MPTAGISCPICGIRLDVEIGPVVQADGRVEVEIRLARSGYEHVLSHRPPDGDGGIPLPRAA